MIPSLVTQITNYQLFHRTPFIVPTSSIVQQGFSLQMRWEISRFYMFYPQIDLRLYNAEGAVPARLVSGDQHAKPCKLTLVADRCKRPQPYASLRY